MFLFSKYKADIKRAYAKLDNYESDIIHTSYGDMQYAIHQGNGIPLLVVHGIVGGYDQAIQTGLGLLGNENTIIGISRFGYLKSEIPSEPTPENQAHVYAEILDKLNIREVFVLATSAGGTPALKFAILYPDRVKGIILIGSGAPSIKKSRGPSGPPSFIYNDFIFWYLIKKMKHMMLSMFGINKEEFDNASLVDKEGLLNLFEIILPIKPRRTGIFIDEKITNPDMIINYNDYILDEINIPFLVIHSKNDPMALYDNMKYMVGRLKNVEFIEYETGGHVLFGHAVENTTIIKKFIKLNT